MPGQVGAAAVGSAGAAAVGGDSGVGDPSRSLGVGKLRWGPGVETSVAGTPPGPPRSMTRTETSSMRASPRPVRAKVTVTGSPTASGGTMRCSTSRRQTFVAATRSPSAGPPSESNTNSPSTLPVIGLGTKTCAEISSSLPGGAWIGGVVIQIGGVSTTIGASSALIGLAIIRRQPCPEAGRAREISRPVRMSLCGRAKCRQPPPESSSIRSMPPPRSSSGPETVAVRAATNCHSSARAVSEAVSGLATIEPSALTPFSHTRRSNWPAMAAARRSLSIAIEGSLTASVSASAASRPASVSIGTAFTGGGPESACGGRRPSSSPALASAVEATARAEESSTVVILRRRSCTCAVTAGSPLKRMIACVMKSSSVTDTPPVTRCCLRGSRPPAATPQA